MMLKESETLIVGYDSSTGPDMTVLSVSQKVGPHLVSVNIFKGEEAEWMYNRLTRTVPVEDKYVPMCRMQSKI